MTMRFLKKIQDLFIGSPRNPFAKDTRQNIALIAFLAWIGLGADGLSSSSYGPEEAFLALGTHSYLAFYLAILTAITVFLIALAYNQVIELFPSGGGGYKVASRLISPRAGVISGSALIVDYILTIAISVASGTDAIFSLLSASVQPYKLYYEIAAVIALIVLNLRGMKESIKLLMPIFLGFVVTHFCLIFYGIFLQNAHLGLLIGNIIQDTHQFVGDAGWFTVLALFLRAYSLGSGTYTGIEAVSNNVNHLAEPRVHTGKWTMFYMAVSLSVTAGGIILLYLLWDVKPVYGQTLNAVVFQHILENIPFSHLLLILLLILEAGLLFVAANTGFLGGPAVLASMAIDGWIPKRFLNLSTRLVTQNGVTLYGMAAIFILFCTHGKVSMLVVLYSMNVFLTFSLSLLGICIYRWKRRVFCLRWFYHMGLSTLALLVCSSILIITLAEKFTSGGWFTVLITSTVVTICYKVKRHYEYISKQTKLLDESLTITIDPNLCDKAPSLPLNPEQPTAVFLIGESIGQGMHTLLWVQRMFPNHFKNFVFLSVGVIDVGSYDTDASMQKMQIQINQRLQYFLDFSKVHGFAATTYVGYGNDPISQLTDLSEKIAQVFSNLVFFSATLISKQENWFYRKLHSEIPILLQHNLHLKGLQVLILPVKLERY